MNNIFYSLLAAFIVIVIFTNCSKQTDTPNFQRSLIGTWQWVSTDGGIAFHIHETPASTGKNVDLKISSDGKYAIYTNNVLISSGSYVLDTRKCIHDHTDKTFINFSSDYDFMVEKLDMGNLEVSDEAYDGIGSGYKRKSLNGY
jgi:hypothetical protein